MDTVIDVEYREVEYDPNMTECKIIYEREEHRYGRFSTFSNDDYKTSTSQSKKDVDDEYYQEYKQRVYSTSKNSSGIGMALLAMTGVLAVIGTVWYLCSDNYNS